MIREIKDMLKRKVDAYEIYFSDSSELSLEADHGVISHVSEGSTCGVGLRVLIGNRLGAASCTPTPSKLKRCVKEAIAIAKVSRPNKNNFFASPGDYSKPLKPNAILVNMDAEGAARFMKNAERSMRQVDKRARVSSAMFSKEHSMVRIVNSEGLDVEDEEASNNYSAQIVFKNRQMTESTSFTIAEHLPLKVAETKEHAHRLMSLLKKEHVKTKTCQVLLTPEALASFLDQTYSFSVSARNIQDNKSLIKKGQKVLDKSITITDDATSPGLFCTSRFDDEGTPSKSFDVIKNGMFKQPLYDLYSASKDGVKSTGNCHRTSFSSTTVMPNNVLMAPGNKEDVISEIDEGIIVHHLLGEHTMDEATGDFSLGVLDGHYVKGGEIQHAIRDTMLAGNFFRMLSHVDAIGKAQKHVISGTGGMYLPELLCKSIRVIGQG